MLAALLFWLTGIYSATAQPFRELPPELDGTMMPIDLSRCDTVPVWGDTLKPCGAVYVSRHGARFLSSENKVRKLEKTLSEARASGTLTEKGERLMSLEKARVFDPFGHGGFDPFGHNKIDPFGQNKNDPCRRYGRGIFL